MPGRLGTVGRHGARERRQRYSLDLLSASVHQRVLVDLLRHERSAPVLVPDLAERAEPSEDSKDDSAPWMPAAGLLERCLALLTDKQRNCLELAFVGGNSHEDISRLTGNPLGTVKSWIRRGLQSLRKCMES